ncbi:MAG TPA: protease inhibitor I42 family protein [Marmoricola sp.]|nr:protease inhibitor I42 family protein [Marmoricola sp.]
MTSVRRILTIAFIGALASTGLLAAPSMADSPVIYHHKNSGDTVKVVKGRTIQISLSTSSDGGYGWVITKGRHSGTFKVISKQVIYPPQTGTTPVVGGLTKTVYTVKATHRGTATFKAVERRSFGNKHAVDHFTLHLHVTKPAPLPGTGGGKGGRLQSSDKLTVKKGHKVTITLDTAADGGYGWAITAGKSSPKFTVLSKKVSANPHAPGVVGGSSKTVYVLRTTATGNATFKAVERRSFDKSDVIDHFTLHLHITAP